jgi:two-component system, NtrC family, nitrogen regulation response regulator NtrX
MHDLAASGCDLLPFEADRRSLLAIPLPVHERFQAVLKVYDKAPFTAADKAVGQCAAQIGLPLLQHHHATQQTHRLLFDALDAALTSTHELEVSLSGAAPPSAPPPGAVLEALRAGLAASQGLVAADVSLELINAVRELALRHGPPAVEHCRHMVVQLRALLDHHSGGQ